MEDQQIVRLYVHFSFTATDGYFQGMLLYFLGTYGGTLYLLYASAQKSDPNRYLFPKIMHANCKST